MKALFGKEMNGTISVNALWGGKDGYLAPYGELKKTETPDGDMVWTLYLEDEQIDPVDYFEDLGETEDTIQEEVASAFDDDKKCISMFYNKDDYQQREYLFDKKELFRVLIKYLNIKDPDFFLDEEYTSEDTEMVVDYLEENGGKVPYSIV